MTRRDLLALRERLPVQRLVATVHGQGRAHLLRSQPRRQGIGVTVPPSGLAGADEILQ